MEPDRLPIIKTHKLFINGQYPRSESGRAIAVRGGGGGSAGGAGVGRTVAYAAHASRKDLRSAVEAARAAQAAWAARDAYNRGQVLYRMAEMLEGRRAEFEESLSLVAEGGAGGDGAAGTGGAVEGDGSAWPMSAGAEVSAAADRLVAFAGWADKFAQVLGCQNPVAGPYHNFTIPEPSGVVAIVSPDVPALLGLVTLIAPAIAVGNAVVAVGSDVHPVPAAILGELCNTADVPAGVVNLLTGRRGELVPWIASHREVDAVVAANADEAIARVLRAGAGENLKRVTIRRIADDRWTDAGVCESPGCIEPVVEFKTIWHPARV